MEKREFLQNKGVIDFYDPAEKVKNSKAVTVRKVRDEKDDRYKDLKRENLFTIRCREDGSEIDGVILAHWEIPFGLIPVELLAGEDYDLGSENFSEREDVEQRIRDITRDDLSDYYDIEDETLLHVIVYSKFPLISIPYDSIQEVDESPHEWLERCGDEVLGGIDAYQTLKDFSV